MFHPYNYSTSAGVSCLEYTLLLVQVTSELRANVVCQGIRRQASLLLSNLDIPYSSTREYHRLQYPEVNGILSSGGHWYRSAIMNTRKFTKIIHC